MPLIKSKSKKDFSDNVSTEMDSGKPQNQALAIAYNMKKKARHKMAEGGHVGSHQPASGHNIHIHVNPQGQYDPAQAPEPKMNEPAQEESDDMVDKIMSKRQGYSEGGKVANETDDQGQMVDQMPSEFDDLALRDDLAFSYTDENSGDEDGSKLNQEDDEDFAVSKDHEEKV